MRSALVVAKIFVCILSAPLTGCIGAPGDMEELDDERDIGIVTLAIATVPALVQCLQVQVFPIEGSMALASQNFATTAGASWTGSVGLGAFSRGSVRIMASTYSVACASVGGATASWVADPVVAEITPGVKTSVTLNFRENFAVAASGNFAPSIAEIAVGQYTTGLRLVDGTVRIIGNQSQPTTLTGVVELAAGIGHSCARRSDGTVWCWGGNFNGELGNGTTTSSWTVPVQVTGLVGATTITAGPGTSCASTASTTYCWGANPNGTIGDGTQTNRLVPTVVGAGSPIGPSTRIVVANSHGCAIGAADGLVRCWGVNTQGQIGNNTTTPSLLPAVAIGIGGAVTLASGFFHTCATDAAGRAYCWGRNFEGQLGLGDTAQRLVPTQIPSLSGVAEITGMYYSTCARMNDRRVSCWGQNNYGQVGDGTAMTKTAPVQILTGATQVRGGGSYSACALISDNSVSCWGQNTYGQLGDGTMVTRFVPVKMKL